jgi:hypothetical protein
MRFVYDDPYTLRNAVEQLAGQQPIATRRERDLPIPVDSKHTRRKVRTK